MSFVTLIQSEELSFSTDQLVIEPKHVQALGNAIDASQKLKQLLEQREQQLEDEKQRGFKEGFQAARQDALEQGRAELAEKLLALTIEAEQQQQQLKQSAVKLAMQIIKRVAEDIGPAQTVASLAHKAVEELATDRELLIFVHPDNVDGVKQRLHNLTDQSLKNNSPGQPLNVVKRAFIDVRADETLAAFDCLIETEFGSTVASLEQQLQSLEKLIQQKILMTSPLTSALQTTQQTPAGSAS